MSPDEEAAHRAMREFSSAIDRYRLDDVKDGYDQSKKRYMIDAFFAGFYAGRDYERSRYPEEVVDTSWDHMKTLKNLPGDGNLPYIP